MTRYLLAALLVVLTAAAAAGDKITVDPNAPKDVVVEPLADEKLVDARLDQKVTIYSGSARLHVVLEDLSKQTGVLIRCGSSPKDWQVRDLPVIVCAKDYPLGKLIRCLADTTHLGLSVSKDKGAIVYRIYRDPTRRSALEGYYTARREAALQRAEWEWNGWAAAGSMSDADFDKIRQGMDQHSAVDQFQSMKAFARIVKTLGTEAKKKLFSGERVAVSTEDGSMGAAVKTLANELRLRMLRSGVEWPDNPPESGSKAYVVLFMEPNPEPHLWSQLLSGNWSSGPAASVHMIERLPGMQPRPRDPSPPESVYGSGVEIRSKDPALQQKINLPKPQNTEKFSFADAARLVSEQSGYAIICEDFVGHRNDSARRAFNTFGDEVPMLRVLYGLQGCGSVQTHVDPENKVIMCSADTWWDRHTNLVSEEYLNWLKVRLDTVGVDLDDCVTMLRLTDAQRQDWLSDTVGLEPLRDLAWFRSSFIWRFYDSLTPEDKLQAKSPEGLPLAKYDPRFLAQMMEDYAALQRSQPVSLWALENPAEARAKAEIPSDVESVRKLVLCIEGRTLRSVRTYTTPSNSTTRYGEGIPRTRYVIFVRNGERKVSLAAFNAEFPIYSPKREQEVYDSLKKTGQHVERYDGQAQ